MSYGYGTHYSYMPVYRDDYICPTCTTDANTALFMQALDSTIPHVDVLWPCPEHLINEATHLRLLIQRQASGVPYLFRKTVDLLNDNNTAAVPSLDDDDIRFLTQYVNEHAVVCLHPARVPRSDRAHFEKFVSQTWPWLNDKVKSVVLVNAATA